MEKLSIIIPAYEEVATIQKVIDGVLRIPLDGLTKEIIIVESNSTDGTQEVVLQYKEHPQVTVILEEQAKGKGHAVRKGLQTATGDYVLIQDADTEYDLDDYPKLLQPLKERKTDFVLGSRHSKERRSWKIRRFVKKERLSQYYFNFGHILFTFLFNITYQQKLKDPFTMYKVFRRSCIQGLTFTANRFDFDWEIVAKLCRKGYVPLEIPVHYESRSLKEGKKVHIFKDPLLWIIACFKYRFCKL